MEGSIAPHGGTLCELLVHGEKLAQLKQEAQKLTSILLTPRQLCDVELLLSGGFSPLKGFMNKEDYDR
jgi:sulfate adenylyltransferase